MTKIETRGMKVKVSALSKNDASRNRAQERVVQRLNGALTRFAKADLSQNEILRDLIDVIGRDPDAVEEILCNGTLRALKTALEHGSDNAAEFMVELSELGNSKYACIVDDESRPKPYWIDFGNDRKVLVRYMRPNQRGLGTRANFEVGFMLWGSSLVLSEAILDGKFTLEGKDVLELGSGLGLCGLVAAAFGKCSSVVLTDFHPTVVNNCRFNLELNGLEDIGRATILDWESPVDEDTTVEILSRQFEVIIASDVVCQPDDCHSIAKVLSRYLAPNGLAYFCLGSPESRYGVSDFQSVLMAKGFNVELLTERDGDLSTWVSSGAGDNLDLLVGSVRSYLLYTVTWRDQVGKKSMSESRTCTH